MELCDENGLVLAEYPCNNIDLLYFMTKADIGGNNTNDVWGWTDELTGKEYVIVGKTNGTAFVDISDPSNPIYLGDLPTNTVQSVWRDIKVCDNYAYIGSEASYHGLQIFDLRKLRNISSATVFEPDVIYDNTSTENVDLKLPYFNTSHNIVSNEDTKMIYGVGGDTHTMGLNMVDISNPFNPSPKGHFKDGYTHDAQSVLYNGPDSRYVGKEIVFACNERWISIMDLSDKDNPSVISSTTYDNSQYCHQGWLTEDHRFFLANDEKDEYNSVVDNTTTYIFNVENLESPFLLNKYYSTTNSIDHNLYIRDKIVYQSNYLAGLRLLDISDVENGNLEEVGYFDILPDTDVNNSTLGTWSNYAYFDSGVVAVTDIKNGLWLLKPRYITLSASSETICYNDNLVLSATCLVNINNIVFEGLPSGVTSTESINNKTAVINLSTFPQIDNQTYNFTIKINQTYTYDLSVTISNC